MEIEEAGQDNAEVIETEAANSPEQSTPEATPQGNPHWKEVEEKLGPNNYAVIKPYLDKADTEHRQGIESLNTRFKPFQSFIEQGVTPEVITQSLGLARQINENPTSIYEKLGEFLAQTGRLPESQQELEEVVGDDDPEDEDPRDAQIRELRERQAQFEQQFTMQQQAQVKQQLDAEADTWLDGETTKIKQAHPDFGEEDLKEVTRIALGQMREGQAPDLARAADHLASLRDRFRTAPRPGAQAPNVPGGAGGGTPSSAVPPHKMTPAERQARVASMLGNS